MRLDFELPEESRRPRHLDPSNLPPPNSVAEIPPPPPPDALSRRIVRNRELSAENAARKVSRPRRQRPRRQQATQDIRPDLPQIDRRPRRDRDPKNDVGIGIHLRPAEVKVLSEVGRFRIVSVRDLAETVYQGDRSALARDLKYLEKKDIVRLHSVNARRDGFWRQSKHIDVVTLTRPGKKIVLQVGDLHPRQTIYAGLVKPHEAEHDTEIYRAYLKEVDRIEQLGGTNPRVILDFEIKRNVQKSIYAQRKANPERGIDEIKEQVAREFNLPVVENQVQIPDARIEYELDQGSRTALSDIEVVTAAYRPGHMRSKAQAGFRLFANARDRARLGRDIEDDHHMLHEILDLG